MDNVKERIRKIRELALRGSGGEQENAQKLFEELLVKYDLENEDFDEEIKQKFDFFFKGEYELKLLHQIFYMVTGDSTLWYVTSRTTGRRSKTCVVGECTEAQKVQIDFLFDFYKKLWWDEVELFILAFIQKHKLFSKNPKPDDTDDNDLSEEEINRMFQMVRCLQDKSPLLEIQDKYE